MALLCKVCPHKLRNLFSLCGKHEVILKHSVYIQTQVTTPKGEFPTSVQSPSQMWLHFVSVFISLV